MADSSSNGCSSTLSRCFGDQSNSAEGRPAQPYETNNTGAFSVTASLGQPATDGINESRLGQLHSSERRVIANETRPTERSTVPRTVLNVSVREEMSSNSATTSPVLLASAKSQVRFEQLMRTVQKFVLFSFISMPS